jgi:predicted O-linked N-acetylglucosamine transferase (SPINDLY family)
MKLSPQTIAVWSEVLKVVPAAKLLLKAPSLRDAAVGASVRNRFAEQGIDPNRIELRGPSELSAMMQEYGDIDIALDPMPYNGGTTTLQALWMGVPVITLKGGNFAGRMGASFLATLDKPDWIAADTADYVAKAQALAEDVATLRQGRAELRQRMQTSPLSDIGVYTQNLEALYRRMWQHHCSGQTTRLLAS